MKIVAIDIAAASLALHLRAITPRPGLGPEPKPARDLANARDDG